MLEWKEKYTATKNELEQLRMDVQRTMEEAAARQESGDEVASPYVLNIHLHPQYQQILNARFNGAYKFPHMIRSNKNSSTHKEWLVSARKVTKIMLRLQRNGEPKTERDISNGTEPLMFELLLITADTGHILSAGDFEDGRHGPLLNVFDSQQACRDVQGTNRLLAQMHDGIVTFRTRFFSSSQKLRSPHLGSPLQLLARPADITRLTIARSPELTTAKFQLVSKLIDKRVQLELE